MLASCRFSKRCTWRQTDTFILLISNLWPKQSCKTSNQACQRKWQLLIFHKGPSPSLPSHEFLSDAPHLPTPHTCSVMTSSNEFRDICPNESSSNPPRVKMSKSSFDTWMGGRTSWDTMCAAWDNGRRDWLCRLVGIKTQTNGETKYETK